MVAVNIPDSKNTFFTPPSLVKNTIGKSTQCKMHQSGAVKNFPFLLMATNKQIADQAFYDVLTKFVSDSQLQDKVASLEQQVL